MGEVQVPRHRARGARNASGRENPVRITLVHNPTAGDSRFPGRLQIVAALAAFGWRVEAVDENDLDRGLASPGDAVVIAGGDGTVGQVARRLAGTGVSMGIIPTGTANNVARTLGIGVEPQRAIECLPHAVGRDIDLGFFSAEGIGGRFLEGLGVGLLARAMAEGPHPPRKTLGHALDVLARELESFEPTPSRIRIDGRELSGNFLVASVMNLRSLGPAIGLAPDARFDDGELDVVLVRPEQRGGLLAHLRGEIDPERLPRFEVHRAKRVRLEGPHTWVHVDDRTTRLEGAAEIWVEPSAARFLIPQEGA